MISLKNLKEDFEYPDAKVVEFEEEMLFVKQYLSAADKYGLIDRCLLSLRLHERPLNPVLSEILFEVELVRAYSNISFEEFRDGIFKEHDVLNLTGLIDLVIKNIPVEEYENVCEMYEQALAEAKEYHQSLVNLANSIISGLASLTVEANEELENFDVEKYEAVAGILKKLTDEKHI